MKNLIIGLVVAVLGVSLTHAAIFNSTVSLDNSRESSYMNAIDAFLEKFITIKTESFLEDKFESVDTKLTTLLKNTALPDRIVFILEYLQYRVNDRLDDHDEDTTNDDVTDDDDSDGDQARMIDVDDYESGPITIVA